MVQYKAYSYFSIHSDAPLTKLTTPSQLFTTRFVNRESSMMVTEFSSSWDPLPEALNHVSYGHDLTAVWMISELAAHLGGMPADDKALLTRLGSLAADRAYDKELGGFFEFGSNDGAVQGRCVVMAKHWLVVLLDMMRRMVMRRRRRRRVRVLIMRFVDAKKCKVDGWRFTKPSPSIMHSINTVFFFL